MVLQDTCSIYIICLKDELSANALNEIEDRCCHILLNGKTYLFTITNDQAELHGILKRLRDIGVEIISLKQI